MIYKIIYWISVSFIIAILLQNSIPLFFNAWLIALLFLPAVVIVKYGIEKVKDYKGLKKIIRCLFIASIALYWGYLAITIAYWYFLELNSESFEEILISPFFIWIIIGFFVLVEYMVFKPKAKSEKKNITIYSNRKKTILTIDGIAYIESRSDFTLVTMIDESQYKNTIKISDWERRLNNFVRIHRSFLINPEISTLSGNEVIINNNYNLPISRSYKQKTVDYFKSSLLQEK